MSFKYVDPDNTGYTAGDADVLTTMDFGALSPGDEKTMKLRIGNTGASRADFTVTGVSANGVILSGAFTISDDDITYGPIASGMVFPLEPNEISGDIYVKYNVPNNAFISDGTIRLYTTEA